MSQEALLDLPLTRVPFVVLDVETTGLVPGLDRIVEISLVQQATAKVLMAQVIEARRVKRLKRFRDLLDPECGRFSASLRHQPLAPPASLLREAPTKTRDGGARRRPRSPEGIYLDEVVAALSDLEIDEEELVAITKLREELSLGEGVVRALHAKVYTSMMVRYTEEGILDETERANLKRLHEALRTLGWAPGD